MEGLRIILFLALSFAVRVNESFQLKKQQALSLQTYPWRTFISNSMKDATFCQQNKRHLDQYRLAILIGPSKEGTCLHYTNRQFFADKN